MKTLLQLIIILMKLYHNQNHLKKKLKIEAMLFTRIHSLKFQNKVAKDSLKRTIKAIGDESLEKGLYFYTFIDIDETNLYVINTWDNEKSSKKVHSVYEDFLKQVKEMGVKMVIVGGSSETSYSNVAILDNFNKID